VNEKGAICVSRLSHLDGLVVILDGSLRRIRDRNELVPEAAKIMFWVSALSFAIDELMLLFSCTNFLEYLFTVRL
jgi:hypothetical protein